MQTGLYLYDNEKAIIVIALNELIAKYNRAADKLSNDVEVQNVVKQIKSRVEDLLDKF